MAESCLSDISNVLLTPSRGAPATSQSASESVSLNSCAHVLRLDQHRRERLERDQLVVDPHAPLPLEQDVELVHLEVPVLRGRFARMQAPEPGTQRLRLELPGEVGVLDAHLVRGTPESVPRMQHSI